MRLIAKYFTLADFYYVGCHGFG